MARRMPRRINNRGDVVGQSNEPHLQLDGDEWVPVVLQLPRAVALSIVLSPAGFAIRTSVHPVAGTVGAEGP